MSQVARECREEEKIQQELREKIASGLEAEAIMRDKRAAKRGSGWSDDAVFLRGLAVRIRAKEFG